MKYKDMDGNGTREQAEPGLSGWTIKVYKDANGDGRLDAGDTAAGSAVTDASGGYSFSLAPGKYILCEVGQTNWSQTAPTVRYVLPGRGGASGGHALTLTSGQTAGLNDFGNTPLSSFDVNFYDLTGSTNAPIVCTAAGGADVGTASGGVSPETTLTANGVRIGTYTCTITIVDP